MLTKIARYRVFLPVYLTAIVIVLLPSLLINYRPDKTRNTGIYIVGMTDSFGYAAVILCIVMVAIGLYTTTTQRIRISAFYVLGGISLIFLAAFLGPNIGVSHLDTLVAQDHVYQLGGGYIYHADTLDAATDYYGQDIFLYECTSLGIVCSLKATKIMHYDLEPIRMRLEGDTLVLFSDLDHLTFDLPLKMDGLIP